MALVAERHRRGDVPWTSDDLSSVLRVPMHAVQAALGALRQGGVLAETADDPAGYLPVRDLDAISVAELLRLVRSAGEQEYLGPASLPLPAPVEAVLARLDLQMEAGLEGLSVLSLAADAGTPEADRGVPSDAS
jgi:DNA-binding IscR family transcriptional regulator